MDTPPARLYKYMPAARQGIFDEWLVRFTQPKALNDPFEMRPHVMGYGTPKEVLEFAARRWEERARANYDNLVRELGRRMTFDQFRTRIKDGRMAQIEEAVAKAPEHKVAMARKIDELMNQRIRVLSLCEHPDSFLMWAHYGDSHRGFVIEFDTASPFFNRTKPPNHAKASEEEVARFAEEYGRLRRIKYQDDRPSVFVTDMRFDIIMTKGTSWKYEGEWRMLMPPDYANETKPPHQGFAVCLFVVPTSAITKVVLGINAGDALVAQALKLRERTETRHIAIEKARIDEQHFQLHFEAL